jgi:hypothetical protein
MPSNKASFLKQKKAFSNKVMKTDGKDKFKEESPKHSDDEEAEQPKKKMTNLHGLVDKGDVRAVNNKSAGLIRTEHQ